MSATIPDPLCISLTGTNHRWQAEYPLISGVVSENNRLRSAVRLHVPVGSDVVLILNSTDYLYTMGIPDFGLKEIAVPNLEFRMSFRPTNVGRFPLVGEELCGQPGENEPATLIVEPQEEFLNWLRRDESSL